RRPRGIPIRRGFEVLLNPPELFWKSSDAHQSPHLHKVDGGLRSLTRSYVLSKRLVLFLWQAVLQGQHGCRPSQHNQSEDNHPQEVECQAVAKNADCTSHCEWPNGTWGEETVDARGVLDFCFFPVLWKYVGSTLRDVQVATKHQTQQ